MSSQVRAVKPTAAAIRPNPASHSAAALAQHAGGAESDQAGEQRQEPDRAAGEKQSDGGDEHRDQDRRHHAKKGYQEDQVQSGKTQKRHHRADQAAGAAFAFPAAEAGFGA